MEIKQPTTTKGKVHNIIKINVTTTMTNCIKHLISKTQPKYLKRFN